MRPWHTGAGEVVKRFQLVAIRKLILPALIAGVLAGNALGAQATPAKQGQTAPADHKVDRSEAYYRFSVAHLYHRLALQFARQEYVDRAIEEYKAAMAADPTSDYIPEQLIELYAASNRLEDAIKLANEVTARDPNSFGIHKLLGDIYRSYAYDRRRGLDSDMANSSIAEYEKANKLNPQDEEVSIALGGLYLDTGSPDKAKAQFEHALEVKPNDPRALAGLAQYFVKAGDGAGAIDALEKVIKAAGPQQTYLEQLAAVYSDQGRFDDAADTYKALLDQAEEGEAGNTLRYREMLAESLVRGGKLDEGREQYQQLAELLPRNALYQLRLSQIARQRRRFDEAWERLKEAQKLSPDDLDIKYNTVLLLDAEGRLDEAIQGLQQILTDTAQEEYDSAQQANRQVFLENLAGLQRRQDKFDDARETYARIAKLNPETAPRVDLLTVDTYRAQHEFERALEESSKAVKEHPDDYPLALQRANLLSETGNAKSADSLLRGLLKDEPSDIDIYLSIAQTWQKGKDYDKAVKALDEASKLADTKEAKVAVLFSRGSILERFQRIDESEAAFRKLLEIDPDNSSTLNYLGYMLADQGTKLDEAYDMIQRALDLEPENGAYLDSLGWVYYQQDKLELAKRYLERSLERYGNDPVVLSHLGDVYFKLGETEQAKKHWKMGLEEWAKSPVADRDDQEVADLRAKLTKLGAEVTQAEKKQEAAKP